MIAMQTAAAGDIWDVKSAVLKRQENGYSSMRTNHPMLSSAANWSGASFGSRIRYTDLQGLVKYLDHKYAVMQGCVRLRNALKCIEMHLGDYHYSQSEPLTSIAAERCLLLTTRSRLTVQLASHERKHNACRAEVGG